ncbi:MAG: CHAT domain-containing protein, partial [Desulfobacterales bacterium]|nr:CHAT domain-containing protein [Desulfobacterales bacterium]
FVSLGEDIFKCFLQSFTGLEDFIKSAESQNQPVLLNIRSDCQEINRIPWELLHHADHGFLGATSRFQIFRTIGKGPGKPSGADAEPGPDLSPGPLKVLFMACSPDGTTPLLNYEQEEEIILKAVGDLKRGKRLEIDIAAGGSLEELVSLLADQEYHVVHLSGHGYYDEAGDAGYIVMEDETGAQKHVNARELADALMGWPSVRLLFLAACETGREDPRGSGLARLLAANGIPMVIGMKNPVGDTAATVMAGSFYRHLTLKRSVSHALQLARGKYEKQSRPNLPRPLPPLQWAIPVLFGKSGGMEAVDWEKPLNPTPPGSPPVILYSKVKHLKTGCRGRRKEFRDHLRMLRAGSPPALCI